MAVNGVEIQAGQVWRTRGGRLAEISYNPASPDRPWLAKRADDKLFSVRADGQFAWTGTDPDDLVELVSPLPAVGDDNEALTFHTLVAPAIDPGRTNPKDAIGDKKAAMHLLSPIAEIHWMIGQYAGTLKYGAWNWRAAGVRSSIYISAMRRHLMGWLSGEEFDPVDGSHHLGNIMACAAILLEAQAIGKLVDDRPPSFSHRPTLEWAEDRMAQLKVNYSDKAPRHYSIADTAECFPPAVQRAPADDTEGGAA